MYIILQLYLKLPIDFLAFILLKIYIERGTYTYKIEDNSRIKKLNVVVLSLGSNIGNRKENLKKAVTHLESYGLKVIKLSSVYETEPIGFKDQDKFYNLVLTAEYPKDPVELLSEIHQIENKLGRVRKFKNSPRTIDIDIITFNDKKMNNEDLIIPHKEFMKRKFVLIPLAEIEPDFIFDSKSSFRDVLSKCEDNSEVVKLTELYNEI